MTLPEAVIIGLMSQQSELTFITLLDIIFEGGDTLHLCNNDSDVTHDSVVYSAAIFTYTPPEVKANSVGAARVTIDIVDQAVVTEVMEATEAPKLIAHTLVDVASGASEKLDDWEFTLVNISWNESQMSGELLYETYLDIEVPSRSFDNVMCPGCH